MDEIFRLLLLRPPAPGVAMTVTPSAQFATALREANESEDPKGRRRQAATELVASARGLKTITDLVLGTKMVTMDALITGTTPPSPSALPAVINQIFGMSPNQVIGAPEFTADRERIADNLIAAVILSADGPLSAVRLEDLLTVLVVVEATAKQDPVLGKPDGLRVLLARPAVIAAGVLPAIQAVAAARPADDQERRLETEAGDGREAELRARIDDLLALNHALASVAPEDIAVRQAEQRPAPAGEVRDTAVTDPVAVLRARLVEQLLAGEIDEPPAGLSASLGVLSATATTSVLPVAPGGAGPRLVLTTGAVAALGGGIRATADSLGLDLTAVPLPAAVARVHTELSANYTELAEFAPAGEVYAVIGGTVQRLPEALSPALAPTAVPTTHGTLKPVGVGDLLVVRQQLKRYEGGEVGHVENVLRGEAKKRTHLRSRTTEQTDTTEEVLESTEERDNQSTERFELKQEAATVQKEDSTFKVGLSVSGSYGPTIEFKASTDFSLNKSKEESAKTATGYSKEISNRAASKVTEKHREERILRTLEVFSETNEHGINNATGNGPVVGVYQWVDKVYESQVYNYGKRMMFDLMIPEPSAFWQYAITTYPKPGATLVRPTPFTLRPKDLNRDNYGDYVQRYQAAGVNPPPEEFQTVAKTFEGSSSHDEHVLTKTAELPLPAGYSALTGFVAATGSIWDDWLDSWGVNVVLGDRLVSWKEQPLETQHVTMGTEEGSVPLTVSAFGWATLTLAVEVTCKRTQRALDAWQLATHQAITQAYLKLDRDYQDALAALQVQTASQILGRNPIENRLIERTELKKHAIAVFTAQHFGSFGAVQTSVPEGYPEPSLTEAELQGRYVRFFEQAFEWEHMTYLFYPYYWGRKANWAAQAVLQDTDIQFSEFLRAGSARAVVPVRPGFESSIAHFLNTGEIWNGTEPPTITDPTYVGVITEIKERDQAKGLEVAQGDPWDVRLPTTLLRLRLDGSLPQWRKNPDGTWSPVGDN
jgi:hypothetical protein